MQANDIAIFIRGMVAISVIMIALCAGGYGYASAAETNSTAPPVEDWQRLVEVLPREMSTGRTGTVQLVVFMDFFSPHSYRFDEVGVPILKREFGDKLEVEIVGFPVLPKAPTAFHMWSQASAMGKGQEIKRYLFRAIHKDNLQDLIDRNLRERIVKELGLDPVAFEAGMATGAPAAAFAVGRSWGERINLSQVPTVLLNGNIKVENIDPANLEVLIASLLLGDGKVQKYAQAYAKHQELEQTSKLQKQAERDAERDAARLKQEETEKRFRRSRD